MTGPKMTGNAVKSQYSFKCKVFWGKGDGNDAECAFSLSSDVPLSESIGHVCKNLGLLKFSEDQRVNNFAMRFERGMKHYLRDEYFGLEDLSDDKVEPEVVGFFLETQYGDFLLITKH